MKRILITLLIVAGCVAAHAQNKHNIYIDLGVNERGVTATYDRMLTKHFAIGLGISTYDYSSRNRNLISSAVFLDLRRFWVKRKSMLFLLADIGAAHNSGRLSEWEKRAPVGFYCGLGFGYQYRINKKGMGPYVSVGMYGHTEKKHYSYTWMPPGGIDSRIFDATSILSVGFKF